MNRLHNWVTLATAFLCAFGVSAQDPTPEQIEFFEKKIRPVLVEKCYACHGEKNNPPLGGLRLHTRAAMVQGGDSGPALVTGKPEESLLITAIRYDNLDLKMPPTGKLDPSVVADFEEWIRSGAPDPRAATEEITAAPEAKPAGISLEDGRAFWSFQPVRSQEPPAVRSTVWPRNEIDRFILAKLEEKGFTPAPPAEKRILIRRVTLDLLGIPPTPEEIEAFVSDNSPKAYENLVNRLLNSPHYGERWARHWLDLMRFAETNGHEFDNLKLDAWRYRDFVIKAFNGDVPYNQFVKEHIAGDLIRDQRMSDDGAYWASPLGTSHFWLWEVLNSAVDSVKSRADEVDNQIDVIGKTFLGLTTACARCHDHKFDPIPTADYYALAGILHSTDITETVIDSPERQKQIASYAQKVADTDERIRGLLRPAEREMAASVAGYLLTASRFPGKTPESEEERKADREEIGRVAGAAGLDSILLSGWVNDLRAASSDPSHLYYPMARLAGAADFGAELGEVRKALRAQLEAASLIHEKQIARGDVIFEDFEGIHYDGWRAAGAAFGAGPTRELAPNQGLRGYRGEGIADSFGTGSDRLAGSLTSEKFRMPKIYVHVRMAGQGGRAGAKEENPVRVTIIADAHKSQNFLAEQPDRLHWVTQRMTKEIGRICTIELVDRSREGRLTVDRIVFSDSEEPPQEVEAPNRRIVQLIDSPDLGSAEDLAKAYETLIGETLSAGDLRDTDARWLAAGLNPSGNLEDLATLLPERERQFLVKLQSQRADSEGKIPESVFAMIGYDAAAHDVPIHIRGNHKNLGDPAPRRFLQVIAGEDQKPIGHGSGRLYLAEWMASERNPLTARVMVNRVWQHHFGSGIVRTPDNFGETGERPTHPELLDYLARDFMDNGWSIKDLHRRIVLTQTYQMSNQKTERAMAADPQNKFLHHMPVRRLEAEAVRDSILAVAGNLDRTLFGPGVMPYISKYQGGRGKPESGPLDADGRRSIYIQVRRNFLTPMLLAFDYPLPTSTIGRRSVSTVPSQALLMLNNEFVGQQARSWAAQVTGSEPDQAERVRLMFRTALGRDPSGREIEDSLGFVEQQAGRYPDKDGSLLAWTDLGHVLFNSAEFVYVQ